MLLRLGVTPLEPRLLQPVEHCGDGRVQIAKDTLSKENYGCGYGMNGYLVANITVSHLAPLHWHVRVLFAELNGSDVRWAYRPDNNNRSGR